MGSCIDQSAGEGCCQEIAKGIALLKHTRNNSTSFTRAIFECGSCGISIQSTHCNSVQGSYGQELLVCIAKASAKLEDDEENVVQDEGPLSSIAIGSNTKGDCANAPEHQHKCDSPGDIGVGLAKLLCQIGQRQRNSEEVKGIPSPTEEANEEEQPLFTVEHCKKPEWVWSLVHRRPERGNASRDVAAHTHVGIRFLSPSAGSGYLLRCRLVGLLFIHDGLL